MIRAATCGLCLSAIAWLAISSPTLAQDRKAKIVNDHEAFKDSDLWTYNNLDEGIAQAKKTGKPLLAVLRCIP